MKLMRCSVCEKDVDPEGHRWECSPPRNYSKLFTDGRCVLCNQPRTPAGYDVHSEVHLARGEAIVDDYRVIPTPTDEESRDEIRPRQSGKRRLDPILARLVRAEQRKQKASR